MLPNDVSLQLNIGEPFDVPVDLSNEFVGIRPALTVTAVNCNGQRGEVGDDAIIIVRSILFFLVRYYSV